LFSQLLFITENLFDQIRPDRHLYSSTLLTRNSSINQKIQSAVCEFKTMYNIKQIFIIISFFLFSCTSYYTYSISKNINNNPEQIEKSGKNILSRRYGLSSDFDKSYPVKAIKFKHVYYKRYFAKSFSFSMPDEINNRGVELALDGKFAEAGILFSETIKEDNNSPEAYNNLGVIYELQNKTDHAFDMYSKACMIAPDNEFYRQNFLFFCDRKQ
jgi:tetratricopeptide (TPR) repeat protein